MRNILLPFNLSNFSTLKREETTDDIIERRKKLSKLLKDSRKQSKLEKCYYCGKPCESFCHSHATPAFCLRNISHDGKIYYWNSIINLQTQKDKTGVSEAGTFELICRECDSKIFQDYETPENYIIQPSQKMLAQIHMKNSLKNISKRLLELQMYNLMGEQLNTIMDTQSKKDSSLRDLELFHEEFKHAKKCVKKPHSHDYYIGFYKKLPYIVPIAFQSNITLISDLDSGLINNVYIQDSKVKSKSISISIFPFKNSSIILLFVDEKNKKYRRFFKQLRSYTEEDQLKIINYMVFSYSEDYFLSPIIPKEILTKLHKLAGKTTAFFSLFPPTPEEQFEAAKRIYNFKEKDIVPNLLAEEFALPPKN